MLVLTTMFINVSNNLPKTSYVKMIDVWLIFNLLLPFIEVLVHTYMDTLRSTFSCFFLNLMRVILTCPPCSRSVPKLKVIKQIRDFLR